MMNIKKIKINFSFYLFIILFLFSGFKNSLIYILLIFIVHELGHIFFCVIFNVKILKLEIYPFGGIFYFNKEYNIEIYKDFLISSGGIIFQMLLFLINRFFCSFEILDYYNLFFLSFNSLPIIPFDGSKILYILISKFFSYYYSFIAYLFISISFLLFFFLMNLFNCYSCLLVIVFSLFFTYKEYKDFPLIFNKFLIERFLHNYKYKKKKYIRKYDIKHLCRGKVCFFLLDSYENEKKLLSKKFDNSSYIW